MPRTLNASAFDTDKALHPPHLEFYAEFFAPFLERDIRLLELGVYHGGSLLLWRDTFARGLIVGLDVNPTAIDDPSGRIRVFQGIQEDPSLLDRIAAEVAPQGFDIIIDDCAHVGALARLSFWHLFENHLKPGGLYAIEDWGTGYWDSWPDGRHYAPAVDEPRQGSSPSLLQRLKARFSGVARSTLSDAAPSSPLRFPSHDYGMVGFIKELVDEAGWADITCPGLGIEPPRPSRFRRMHLSHALVIIEKAHAAEADQSTNDARD